MPSSADYHYGSHCYSNRCPALEHHESFLVSSCSSSNVLDSHLLVVNQTNLLKVVMNQEIIGLNHPLAETQVLQGQVVRRIQWNSFFV